MSRNLEKIAEVVKRVVAVRPEEGGGFEVELECGHRSTWAVDPPGVQAYCSQCLDELIEKLRKEGKQ